MKRAQTNSFKDTIATGLADFGIKHLSVNRDATVNGVPSVAITFFVPIEDKKKFKAEYTFAKANQMSAEHMVKVIRSFLAKQSGANATVGK